MKSRVFWMPWAIVSVSLAFVAAVAYFIGAHQGDPIAADSASGGWWHGLGVLFVLFWMFSWLRFFWWGPGWRRPRPYYGYPSWRDGDREDWEAWHRRAHERMEAAHRPAPAGGGTARDPIA